MHSTENKGVIGSSNVLFASFYAGTFQPGTFSRWGSYGVNQAGPWVGWLVGSRFENWFQVVPVIYQWLKMSFYARGVFVNCFYVVLVLCQWFKKHTVFTPVV